MTCPDTCAPNSPPPTIRPLVSTGISQGAYEGAYEGQMMCPGFLAINTLIRNDNLTRRAQGALDSKHTVKRESI
jgi:hypothetical protein